MKEENGMKVLFINGSPKERGCTYTALREVASQLRENNIETEILHIGGKLSLVRGLPFLFSFHFL